MHRQPLPFQLIGIHAARPAAKADLADRPSIR
jgi:hypothetical protein